VKIIGTIREMQAVADELRYAGKRIAVVPTMGSLHQGHLSLIGIAREHADLVITTIFVNPTQFGPGEDFSKYPRDLKRDTSLVQSAGTDVLFIPATGDMYPEGYQTSVDVERLTRPLEGKSRPTHFRGVATVVAKLFICTKPHVAVFGQKDAQQVRVIRQMVRDFGFDIEVIVGPIVREADGLAMSSRNVYLSEVERAESVVLSQSLGLAEKIIREGERRSSVVIARMKQIIGSKRSANIDYISVADADTLEELENLHEGMSLLVSLAVRFGTTRLIDNILISC
jgi:pantoate--beta-alanine ligase